MEIAFSQSVINAVNSAAASEGLEAAALLTVVEVESSGKAFTQINGASMPLILYEYHVFYRYPELTLSQRNEAVRRNLAARRWGDLPYMKTQKARYNQLKKAATINEQAAYAACSWGVGQVLGENAGWLGYDLPKTLAQKASLGIDGQIEVMLRFIKKRGLVAELQGHDWRGFARSYNGKGQVDYYSKRMAAAYKRITGSASTPTDPVSLRVGATGDEVASLQRMLRTQGYHLIVDGDFGPATRRQVMLFQLDQGLAADGVAGPVVIGRLEALAGVPNALVSS